MQLPNLRTCMMLMAVSALAACSPAPTPASVDAGQSETDQSQLPVADSRPSVAFIRGYYEASDGGLFTACSETSRRRVTSIDVATAAAMAKANQALDRPRYLMAEGNLSGKDEVEIGPFNLISGDAWNCESRLDDVVLAARGADVLWSLEVTPAAVTFAPAPGAAPEIHAFEALQPGSDGLGLKTTDSKLSASLHSGACIETMTDTTFGWSIKLMANGQTFVGCAWRGLAAP